MKMYYCSIYNSNFYRMCLNSSMNKIETINSKCKLTGLSIAIIQGVNYWYVYFLKNHGKI